MKIVFKFFNPGVNAASDRVDCNQICTMIMRERSVEKMTFCLQHVFSTSSRRVASKVARHIFWNGRRESSNSEIG